MQVTNGDTWFDSVAKFEIWPKMVSMDGRKKPDSKTHVTARDRPLQHPIPTLRALAWRGSQKMHHATLVCGVKGG